MTLRRDTLRLPYTPRQLFGLVADVPRYPEFLPWCRAARILERDENGFTAELVICFKGVSERYVSRVELFPPADGQAGRIEVSLVSGPFRRLSNLWRFIPLPEGGTEIDFELDFEFRSLMLQSLIGALYARAVEKMTDAFRARAEALYGSKP